MIRGGGENLGKVIHFEIPADNPVRAVDFYKKVFGWKFEKYGPMNYWLITAGDKKEPGINGAIAEKDETHPTTVNTISVPSFEAAVAQINEAGGEVLMSKMAVPGVGYMTYCKDTEGNIFGIMQTDSNAK
jgi:predicted enzyme related to lactoylglutathione lyase